MYFFTIADLRAMLAPVSPERQVAILFCLETGTDPAHLWKLTYRQLARMSLTPIAEDIVKGQIQHPKVNYVFWERGPALTALPMSNLDDTIDGAFMGRSFATLKRAYETMVMIDTKSDAAHFKGQFEGVF